MRPYFSVIFTLCILLVTTGCISEFDFLHEKKENGFLVVSGVISNSTENRRITVSRFNDLDTSSTPVSVTGSVFKNDQLEAELIADSIGVLSFPQSFKLEEGAAYHVEMTTADNQVFKSNPEIIQPLWKADSMSIEVERRVVGTNAGGGPRYEWFVDVFTHIRIPVSGEVQKLLRTQMDEAWAVKEVQNPRDPFNDIVRTCYPTKDITENPSLVLNTGNFVPGETIKVKTGSHIVDQTFLHKHYFNVYLHSLGREAFEYFSSAQRLIDIEGNFFDEIPAPLSGNVYNTDSEGEKIYGYVEFSQADTIRLGVEYRDVGRSILNYCEQYYSCTYNPPNSASSSACYCLDCHLVYGFESLYKPPYWED
ncbi:MAG: DUF4249 family protein [Bacteroidetes bacterium]|nr:DUF4249 family protein [Bacteroidota bacterium]MCB0843490.1 DUF4249 family protein [Bacteroidota bacterium]